MHFVTGGAYNGKSRWVREYYKAQEVDLDLWISAYESGSYHNDWHFPDSEAIVIEGMEQFIKKDCLHMDTTTCRSIWNSRLENWLEWESVEPDRLLIIIGSDITRGIVPIGEEDRTWRDITGWVYQDLSLKADRVDLIWYGLNKQMK
ncbi:bifunctional adenosylcobinamide kinase/adenosylcobinamide-phosphate guanylyltransferase [Bacillus sp. V5-8f]|uniref:bifunctional adenosylcobinamide kinase/adenosylcobinamide-phosphate guanylyltransferase n=1 Tax=Bacillus sp. V5-8f TaxID=2053044 RepID=UPI000C763607|nr:bifunctional adenosylcobinamide kinase/adenosylcobinamide-phosphate guanylyltransferase [Bacillus sp. V5-8f]PLT35938.1 hypothetical protein CUU64_01290 [Bacillus sp. V5-8f]